jgi:glyoxylase-like metal-dependent hydrolase (beta-lactamase superfamily II)
MKRIFVSLVLLLLSFPIMRAQSPWFNVKESGKQIWQIDDHGAANIWLIEGNDSALIIDAGMGSADLVAQVRKLTVKPLIVVNTHGHPDHVGADYQFRTVYIHPADLKMAESLNTPERRESAAKNMLKGQSPTENEKYKGIQYDTRFIPVKENYIFDLGGRKLKVIETPGHTPGGISLLDEKNKLLFTGDNNNTLVWLFLPECKPLHVYLETLEKQAGMIGSFTTIFPGHGGPVASDFILDQIKCVKGILDKSLEAKPYESFAGKAMISTFGRSSVTFNPANL